MTGPSWSSFMVVVGGIGTIEGPIIGMIIYIALRELFADFGSFLSDSDGGDRCLRYAQGTWWRVGLDIRTLWRAAVPGQPEAGTG